jgi:hypothetical protein
MKIVVSRASQFVDKLGVDTHINYTDGQYSDLTATLAALKYLGIDHVRDAAPNLAADPYGQTHLNEAAAAGIKFMLGVSRDQTPAEVVALLHDFAAAHPGSITSIDGPNEVNNWPVTYHGETGVAGALAYQNDLFALINSDPLLKGIPVNGFTGYPVTIADSDQNTIHPYPKNGDQPTAAIQHDLDEVIGANPNKPLLITEIGYHTAAPGAPGWEGVSEAVQAKLILNSYMDGAFLGSSGTYIYQLLDAYAGNSQEDHFGLFRLDNSPKPAAVAIHNLTSILADNGAEADSFATSLLNFTTENLPSSGHTHETQKSDGSHQIILWAEPDIWNEETHTAIAAAGSETVIKLGAAYKTVDIYDPLSGSKPIQTLHDVSSVTLNVTDHPLIVEVSAASQATAPEPANPTPTNPASVSLQAGSGTDTLVLKISEDAWKGDARYTVSVDGQQVGGTFAAKADHDSDLTDTLTLHGNWGDGSHQIGISFLNDSYGGSDEADRNLYLESLTYNGVKHGEVGETSLYHGFTTKLAAIGTPDTPPTNTPKPPTAVNEVGSGPDTLVIKVSEDAWKGDATYNVLVDGKQIGGTFTAKASHAAGETDTLTLHGDWNSSAHAVTFKFLNDAYGGTTGADRNLYLEGVTYNGVSHDFDSSHSVYTGLTTAFSDHLFHN